MNPEKHAEFIARNASIYAQAKSKRIGAELKLKTIKAHAMRDALENGYTQVSAQEREAYASELYAKTIDELVEAVAVEETLKYELEASRLSIDIFRTREASERLAIRSHE
jgi:flagellar biosynthesis regulator FlaF